MRYLRWWTLLLGFVSTSFTNTGLHGGGNDKNQSRTVGTRLEVDLVDTKIKRCFKQYITPCKLGRAGSLSGIKSDAELFSRKNSDFILLGLMARYFYFNIILLKISKMAWIIWILSFIDLRQFVPTSSFLLTRRNILSYLSLLAYSGVRTMWCFH